DLHPEDRLDRLADLDLVRVGSDDERVHAHLVGGVRLLGDHRPDDHVARVLLVHASSPLFLAKRAMVVSSDDFVKTSQSLTRTSYGFSSSGSTICTRGTLRNDFHVSVSVRCSTMSTRSGRAPWTRRPSESRRATPSLVFGASMPKSSTTITFSSAARSESA